MIFHELPEVHLVVREDKVCFSILHKILFEPDQEKTLLDNIVIDETVEIYFLSDDLLGHTFHPIRLLDLFDCKDLTLLVDNFEDSSI